MMMPVGLAGTAQRARLLFLERNVVLARADVDGRLWTPRVRAKCFFHLVFESLNNRVRTRMRSMTLL